MYHNPYDILPDTAMGSVPRKARHTDKEAVGFFILEMWHQALLRGPC